MRSLKLALLTVVVALIPSSAMAAPALDPTPYTPSNTPGHITGGPDGNVWFAIAGGIGGKEYGKITPAGAITEFDAPTDNLALADVTSGPNGHLWFSYAGGVLEVDPATGVGAEHPIAGLNGPKGIAADANGNLWAVASDHVAKIGSNGLLVADFQLGIGGGPTGRDIVLGGDNRLYLANFGTNEVLAFNPADPNNPQHIAVGGGPQELASGGGQVAVSVPSDVVGRISPAGVFSPTTATLSDTTGLAYGRDTAYWGAEFGINKIGRLSADGVHTAPFNLPGGSGPRYVAAAADGTLFVTAETSKKIFRITGIEPPPPPTTTTTEPPTTTTTTPPPPPPPDITAPLLSKGKVDIKKRRLTLTLDEPAALNIVIQQKVKRGTKKVWKRVRPVIKKQGKVGVNTISLGKKFKKGTYRVQVTGTDVAGNKTAKPKTVGFKVKK
jgi:streptogramin lyase